MSRLYSVTVPPGWVRLELDGDDRAEKQVRALVDHLTASVPRDSAPALRRPIENQLRDLVADARARGAVDLLVPVDRVAGLTLPASVMATVVTVPEAGAASHEDVLVAMVARGSGEPVAVGDAVAVRSLTRRDVTAQLEAEVTAAERALQAAGAPAGPLAGTLDDVEPAEGATSRHVRYLLGIPGRPAEFLALTLAVLEPADDPEAELGDALTELFDAVVSTLRWS
ncbi:hypothetical protein KZX45_13350 [Georgenia sp. EYE_87]|uniref:hypothetical protein n=1 Tax=Georgenia sp. EYE_87 TaxID=2853448 RepID=UPI00200481EC|nr:hypothetical protein [Georgenia sp. EYE_87]MCK6211530.1 hypothetical protein [Georgenia sp. EYE_87]